VAPSGDHHHPHTVQFYTADAVLLQDLTHFVGDALDAGRAALVVAVPARQDALAVRLQARGVDLAGAAAQGRYIALDAAHSLSQIMRNDRPDPVLFDKVVGDMVVRAGVHKLFAGEKVRVHQEPVTEAVPVKEAVK